jgi:acyl-CoA hydrolase
MYAVEAGAGVVTSRGDVHYVVTEYGVAQLHGLSIRERIQELIRLQIPNFMMNWRSMQKSKNIYK